MKLEHLDGLFLKQLRKKEQEEVWEAHRLGLIDLSYSSTLHSMLDLQTVTVKKDIVYH